MSKFVVSQGAWKALSWSPLKNHMTMTHLQKKIKKSEIWKKFRKRGIEIKRGDLTGVWGPQCLTC